MLLRKQGQLIKVMRADPPDGNHGGVHSRPRPRTRHVVLGTFHADGEVPAKLTAALDPQESQILSRWLDAYRRSRPVISMPSATTSDLADLDALSAGLGAGADSVCAAYGEALRSRLQRIKRGRTRSAHNPSRRDGRQRPSEGSLIRTADDASPIGKNAGAAASS
ncbi:hypothetical protein [Burkholderia glumae]|uniref:hypothetical protein n=1 Tax=Burkholderia glumae TaxID=337 RepID=UPI002151311C|nr:hypothetical protein [Burkholderia glumae]UVT00105.1 hypothetical protein EFP19_30715 [Burkholderia glumae]